MNKTENIIDLRRFFRELKRYKWLLLAGIVVCTSFGIWMSVRSMTKYEIQGQVLIGDDNKPGGGAGGAGSMAQMMKTFSVGGFSASTVDNEVLIMQSHDVLLRVVRMLELNRTYVGKTKEGKREMLYRNSPIRVEAPAALFDTLTQSFNIKVTLNDDNTVDVKATKGFFKKTLAESEGITLPHLLKTPYGDFQILAANDSASVVPCKEVNVTVSGNEGVAIDLYEKSEIDVATKLSDIINVDYECANLKLGKAIVNAIMNEYNAMRLERLHSVSKSTVEYYDERIAEVFNQLRSEEEQVADYQRKNKLAGVEAELELLVEYSVEGKNEIEQANHNIAYYETVLGILRNRANEDVMVPHMMVPHMMVPQKESPKDPNIEALNEAIQMRQELRRSATDDNEAMKSLNEKIENLRNLIIENSTKMIAKARADLQHKQQLAQLAQGRLDKYPDFNQEYTNLVREIKYQTALYQFLISERENAVLQMYSTDNIGFIFQNAYLVDDPSFLKKLLWPGVMIVFALFCCICFTLFMMLINRKITDTMDLASLGIEENAVKHSGDKESINLLRTKLISNPAYRVLYFASLSESDRFAEMLKDSLMSIGRSVVIANGFSSNDQLMTPAIQDSVAKTLAEMDYIILTVPESEKISNLQPMIDSENAVLIVELPSNKIARQAFKKYLKGQVAAKVFTIIS